MSTVPGSTVDPWQPRPFPRRPGRRPTRRPGRISAPRRWMSSSRCTTNRPIWPPPFTACTTTCPPTCPTASGSPSRTTPPATSPRRSPTDLPPSCRGSARSTWPRRAAGGRSSTSGRVPTPPCWPTWTSTCRRTWPRCCRWSHRCCPATPTWRSGPGCTAGRGSCAAPKREVISRCYNLLLRGTLAAHFSDAQCGFKAIRAEVAQELLPLVEDTGWFFDTEMLVLAERCGLRIHEVPVDWVDDPDSRVEIMATAVGDLKGIARIGRGLASGRVSVASVRAHLGRTPLDPAPDEAVPPVLLHQVVRFGAIGIGSTVAYLLLYLLLSSLTGAQPANFLALSITAVANTAANRRITFGVRGPRRRGPTSRPGIRDIPDRAGPVRRCVGPAAFVGPQRLPAQRGVRVDRRQSGRHGATLRPVARLGVPQPARPTAGHLDVGRCRASLWERRACGGAPVGPSGHP